MNKSSLPDYKTNDPRGWCGDAKRGAALGRVAIDDAGRDFAGKLVLRRVHLDAGGYDGNGTYFGDGEPLYWFADADGMIDRMLRAKDRAEAKRKILAIHPKARFYR